MAGDVSCWQCGHPVPGALEATATAETVKEQWSSEASGRSLSALAFYAGLTTLVMILALAVTLYLGNQPLVQSFSQRAPDGWSFVTGRDRSFTLLLPDEWALFDDSSPAPGRLQQLLADNPAFTEALRPLSKQADDIQILLLALNDQVPAGEQPASFIVVARSHALSTLTVQEVIDLANESEITSLEAQYVENFDKSHIFIDANIPLATGMRDCRQQFHPGETSSLLLAVCGRGQNDLVHALDSFQRLEP